MLAVERRGAMPTHQPTSQPAEPTDLAELYERDYYTWTGLQAQALRARKILALDWDNLAEEVEGLGKAEVHRLEGHPELLLMRLLKWVYQSQRRSHSWSNSIEEHRFRIRRVLRDNPGLKAKLHDVFAAAHDTARFATRRETTLDLSTFPESCPWNPDDTMRDDFWPGGSPTVKRSRRAYLYSPNL
jgi:hypothetical protein